jgi:ABC-2 type transport system ATP-binding protein
MNAIEVEDLIKRFDNFTAVDHICFNVQQGELFGFLGPNGAGKTTSVRMITGVIKPDGGRASIMGYDVESDALKAKQAMGVLPETSNAYIDLSAWQNLMLMGKLYGLAKNERQRRAEDLLKRFDLYEKREFAVKGFSKGMKQRLQICMALISEPQVLIMDEPTSGLDVQSSRLIRSIIADLNAQGVTFLITTHNMEEANQLCSRIAIINRGKIVAIDRPEVLKNESRACTPSRCLSTGMYFRATYPCFRESNPSRGWETNSGFIRRNSPRLFIIWWIMQDRNGLRS